MGYVISSFDGLALPEYLRRSDEQNLGTGAALTSFQQISNGFFDQYGSRRSPQGIRPITKTCVLWGNTAEELKNNLDALRGKIGVRGKLTVAFDDGSLRWQWARLQSLNAPRPATAKANWLPCELTWITASQHWYGVVVSPKEWTWGDGSWVFGDGTAVMGESGTEKALLANGGGAQAFTVTHGGSIPATNVAVTFKAGTSSITGIRYHNNVTGEHIELYDTVAAGRQMTINGGDRSVRLFHVPISIAAINGNGQSVEVRTATAHSLFTGDTVRITGTGTVWDGIWSDVTVVDSDEFTFANSYLRSSFTPSGATVERATNSYTNFRANHSHWPTLAPGNNSIYVEIEGNETQDATISWEFFTHYA